MAQNFTPFEKEDLKDVRISSSRYEFDIKNSIRSKLVKIFQDDDSLEKNSRLIADPNFRLKECEKHEIRDSINNHYYHQAFDKFFKLWTGNVGNNATMGILLDVLVDVPWQSVIDKILDTQWDKIIGIYIPRNSSGSAGALHPQVAIVRPIVAGGNMVDTRIQTDAKSSRDEFCKLRSKPSGVALDISNRFEGDSGRFGEKVHDLGYPSLQIVPTNSKSNSRGHELKLCSHPIRFGVGRPVPNFTGRGKELAKLQNFFNTLSINTSGQVTQVVAICGMGGIGKTELAKKFIKQLPKNDTSVAIWLNGENTDTLMSSVVQICDLFCIPLPPKEEVRFQSTQLVMKIIKKLDPELRQMHLLVVIDNVDEMYEDFEKVVRDFVSCPKSMVIITSRTKDIFPGDEECKFVDLEGFEEKEAIHLVKSALGCEISESDARKLCTLGNFPLALQQAVAYIKYAKRDRGKKYGISEYLKDFSKRFKRVVKNSIKLMGYEKTTATVWDITIEKIRTKMGTRGKLAYTILEVLAFVDPDGIEVDFLRKFVSQVTKNKVENEEYEEALDILSKYFFVNRQSSTSTVVSIDRLVQKVTRYRMEETVPSPPDEGQDCQMSRAAEVLSDIVRSLILYKTTAAQMIHVLSVLRHCLKDSTVQNVLIKQLKLLFNEQHSLPDLKPNLLRLSLVATMIRAEKIYQNFSDDPNLLEKYSEELKKYKSVYKRKKLQLGEEEKDTLSAGHTIVCLLLRLRRYPEALNLGRRVLQSEMNVFGETSPEAMESRTNLTIVLWNQGKVSEAMKLYEKVVLSEFVKNDYNLSIRSYSVYTEKTNKEEFFRGLRYSLVEQHLLVLILLCNANAISNSEIITN